MLNYIIVILRYFYKSINYLILKMTDAYQADKETCCGCIDIKTGMMVIGVLQILDSVGALLKCF